MAYRRVSYFEQTYYIIAAWLRGLLRKRTLNSVRKDL